MVHYGLLHQSFLRESQPCAFCHSVWIVCQWEYHHPIAQPAVVVGVVLCVNRYGLGERIVTNQSLGRCEVCLPLSSLFQSASKLFHSGRNLEPYLLAESFMCSQIQRT